ncbi:hypothetical protein HanIR_Chr12g0594811 [Helianthus annuus]|nr:hypothetical protein HanIR_Chr12g0594811 [Helianthus annuus]
MASNTFIGVFSLKISPSIFITLAFFLSPLATVKVFPILVAWSFRGFFDGMMQID